MADGRAASPGTIGWIDLTVRDAEEVKDFYIDVVGWTPDDVPMGDYSDFNMASADGEARAGVCHARGANKSVPPGWMIYIIVEHLDTSLEACRARGGQIIGGVRSMGGAGRYAFIRDPAGAACALFEPAA